VLSLEPGARAAAPLRVHIPENYRFPYPRLAITADVTLDGRRLGQVAEATVEKQVIG
jgi:hypothetical protein